MKAWRDTVDPLVQRVQVAIHLSNLIPYEIYCDEGEGKRAVEESRQIAEHLRVLENIVADISVSIFELLQRSEPGQYDLFIEESLEQSHASAISSIEDLRVGVKRLDQMIQYHLRAHPKRGRKRK